VRRPVTWLRVRKPGDEFIREIVPFIPYQYYDIVERLLLQLCHTVFQPSLKLQSLSEIIAGAVPPLPPPPVS
jgi:hypothetical protein